MQPSCLSLKVVLCGARRWSLLLHYVSAVSELHKGHLGVFKTKSLAKSLLWWPRLDAAIEWMVKACALCQTDADNPSRVSLLWPPTDRLWQHIHVDFAGLVTGRMFLVVIDTYSKWPNVAITQRSSSW